MLLFNTSKGRLAFVIILCSLCIVETLCFSYFKLFPSIGKFNSLLYFISGAGICVLSIAFAFNNTNDEEQIGSNKNIWLPKAIPTLGIVIFLSVLYIQFGQSLFPSWPINYRDADMLPLIQKGCERLLVGEDVYAPVTEIWGGEQMPYLPAMWMPFVPSVWLGADLRWTSLAVSLIAYIILFAFTLRLRTVNFVAALLTLSLVFFMQTKFYTWEQYTFFGLSEEAVPAFFYVLLMLAFMLRNYWFIGIFMALCTLSRYALIPLIPFFFLWLLVDKNYKGFVSALFAYIAVIVILFVPFLVQRPEHFLNTPPGYINGEKYFWPTELADNSHKTNLGLAYFIGYKPAILQHARHFLILITGAWASTWLLLYYKYKQQLQNNKGIWLMAGLKTLLVLFYNFINLPYDYLFIVPTLATYPLLVAILRRVNLTNLKTT